MLDIRGLPSPVGCACVEIDDKQNLSIFISYEGISFVLGRGLCHHGWNCFADIFWLSTLDVFVCYIMNSSPLMHKIQKLMSSIVGMPIFIVIFYSD